MELRKRKANRLKEFDYSTPGAYFVTICTKDRKNLFWKHTRTGIVRPEEVALSEQGTVVEKAIRNIPVYYPGVSVDQYVIMPNHIHLLLQIHTDGNGKAMQAPPISIIIQQMKGYVTKELGYSVWQKLFHDHIIRNEADYRKIWNYIVGNPMKWEEDCFYSPAECGTGDR